MSGPARVASRIDWPKFYRHLDSLVVQLPRYEPGDAYDLNEVSRLLTRVQANRDRLDNIARKVGRMLAEVKRRLDVEQEMRRIARLSALSDPAIASLRTRREREDAAEEVVNQRSAVIALLRGRRHELEAAQSAVDGMLRTLQAAKESLNAIKSIALAGSGSGGGHDDPRRF